MENLNEILTPEVVTAIEQTYGSVAAWMAVAADWTSSQLSAFYTAIVEDVFI